MGMFKKAWAFIISMGLYSFKAIWVEGWSTIRSARFLGRTPPCFLRYGVEDDAAFGVQHLFHFLYHFLQMSAVSNR